MSKWHPTRVAALTLAAALLLGSCADGGEDRPAVDPTRSPSQQPSRTASLPSPTGLPTGSDATAEPEPEQSDSAEAPETPSETPEPTPTDSATPTATAEASPTTPSEDADDETAEDADAVPAGVWWLLAALVAGLAIGVPLVLRSRRQKTWQADLAAAKGEAAWLTRELLPELRRSVSREQVAGGWAVSSARVRALEDRLTALEATSPDEPAGAQPRALRDAVRAARVRVEALVAPGSSLSTSSELAGVSNDLEGALQRLEPASHRS